MKKLIVTAATALGMAAAAEDVVVKQAPESAPKPKKPKKPSANKKPSWWNKKRYVQARAGRVRAKMPDPMTRQVRRRMERKGW